MVRFSIYPTNSSAPKNVCGPRAFAPATILLVLFIFVSLSIFSTPKAFGQSRAVFGESAWNLGVTLSFSEDAALAAAELVDQVNSMYGTSLTALPLALVNFRDTHVLRGQDLLVIGNGLRLYVGLILIVEDPESLTGYTDLVVAIFENNLQLAEYSVEEGWVTLPPDTTVEDLLSDITRKYSISRMPSYTVEGPEGPQELTNADNVNFKMVAQGPAGFAGIMTSYVRRNTSDYMEIIPELEMGCAFDPVIGVRFISDPARLFDFYKRSTTWIIPEEDRGRLLLQFQLRDELLSRIFADPGNTVSGCEEEFRDSFFQPIREPQ